MIVLIRGRKKGTVSPGVMAAGKEFSREEGNDRLAPSSTVVRVAEICAHVSVDFALVPLTLALLMALEQVWTVVVEHTGASACLGVDAQLLKKALGIQQI